MNVESQSLCKNGLGKEAFLVLIISSGWVVASNTKSGTVAETKMKTWYKVTLFCFFFTQDYV